MTEGTVSIVQIYSLGSESDRVVFFDFFPCYIYYRHHVLLNNGCIISFGLILSTEFI